MMHSAWDPTVGYYMHTGIDMVAPIYWTPLQQEGDPIAFVRALQSQMLFDELVTLGATHTAAALAFRTGVNVDSTGLPLLCGRMDLVFDRFIWRCYIFELSVPATCWRCRNSCDVYTSSLLVTPSCRLRCRRQRCSSGRQQR